MFTENIYDRVLIEPAKNGSNELLIVSGYSSATFLSRHINDLKKINPKIKINLLIGMHQNRNDHSAYLNIKSLFIEQFEGYYYLGRPGVHSKTYSWIKDGVPKIGFSGSANYSQYGFFNTMQQNQMVEDDALATKDYFGDVQDIFSSSIIGALKKLKYSNDYSSSLLLRLKKIKSNTLFSYKYIGPKPMFTSIQDEIIESYSEDYSLFDISIIEWFDL